jgi:hypothetical protein
MPQHGAIATDETDDNSFITRPNRSFLAGLAYPGTRETAVRIPVPLSGSFTFRSATPRSQAVKAAAGESRTTVATIQKCKVEASQQHSLACMRSRVAPPRSNGPIGLVAGEEVIVRFLYAFLGYLLVANVIADDGATKMSRDELLAFLPGTKVKHINQGGSERHWTNESDGTLYVTTNNKIYGSALGSQVAGHAGKWWVNEQGQFCIDVDWSRAHEKWCSYIVKGNGDSYFLNQADEKHKIFFSR